MNKPVDNMGIKQAFCSQYGVVKSIIKNSTGYSGSINSVLEYGLPLTGVKTKRNMG
jgi:hypothetical protein